ncbi:MAG: Lrp/AsnC family transcriptional regulator [Thaumarchaeota archaeon]|nr:Lrp/AsnC family transcriptional regulator [Candidatus Calditenuaceae archaeon]MDW8186825.1 Lrp/AsnC family transcriptional regulator [Nitrososphaerota archaeon]
MSVRSMDEKDRKLIEYLARDARMPYKRLGELIGLSEGAVRKRVKRLREQGLLRFTVVVDDKSMVKAVTMINVDPGTPTPAVAETLSKLEGILEVHEVTGNFDAVAIILARDMASLNRCIDSIRRIKGIKSTNTCIVLRSVQSSLPSKRGP